jgi:hypothetical protein
VDRFAAAGGRLDHEAAGAIVDASGGNSYYAQQIAHELLNISTRPRWPEDLESAVATALAHQSPAFYFFWDSIKSRTQRRYLLAVAREGKTTSRSALIERYGLKSASHVQKAVRQLDAESIGDDFRLLAMVHFLCIPRNLEMDAKERNRGKIPDKGQSSHSARKPRVEVRPKPHHEGGESKERKTQFRQCARETST